MKGPGSGGGQASEVGWKLGGSSYMRGLESSGADFQHWPQGLVTNYFYPLTYSPVTTVDLDFFSLPKWPYRYIHKPEN